MGIGYWELGTGHRNRPPGTGLPVPAPELTLAWALGTDSGTGTGHWAPAPDTGTEPDPDCKKGTTNKQMNTPGQAPPRDLTGTPGAQPGHRPCGSARDRPLAQQGLCALYRSCMSPRLPCHRRARWHRGLPREQPLPPVHRGAAGGLHHPCPVGQPGAQRARYGRHRGRS